MSFWLISVPHNKSGPSTLAELNSNIQGNSSVKAFDIPALKVGTLDQLMALSEDTAKMDTYVGGVAKKIEKTYYEMWKTEAQELQAAKEKTQGANAASSSSSSNQRTAEEKAPELRIDNKTSHEFVSNWQWNDVRYPRRSALRALSDIIIKDSTKNDEALKKQVAEFNEVRTAFTTIERKDQGTLLVKPLGPYVSQPPIETNSLTTLMIVVPRARQQEFLDSYETLEAAALQREIEEQKRKAIEAEEKARKEAERIAAAEAKEAEELESKTPAQRAALLAKKKERELEKANEAEAKKLEEEMKGGAEREKLEAEKKAAEEEEKQRNKKLPRGCNAVVPRSCKVLCDEANEEFLLVSIVVLKQGVEHYKNLCREKRYTVRPFKFDPEEDKAERERKAQLAIKKKSLFNFLMRWCTTTYTEVFTAWIHLKAIRLYVESVLRYGLPYNAQAMLLEPARGREKQTRDLLKNLYQKLAGNNATLTTALDPNEPDLSGLGSDFYPYVYLPLTLVD